MIPGVGVEIIRQMKNSNSKHKKSLAFVFFEEYIRAGSGLRASTPLAIFPGKKGMILYGRALSHSLPCLASLGLVHPVGR
jgi:hypothetical protein